MFSLYCAYKTCTKMKTQKLFSGLPQSQEKLRKMGKVMQKWGFLKNVRKTFFKKVRFCQFKFTKFLIFESLQMVKNY